MRDFDRDGLILSEYQGKLFEKSSLLNCSSAVFLRRFIHSQLLKALDTNSPAILSLDVNEGMSSIIDEFGDTDYGKVKYSPASLFWMGYMYRYISYTREQSTKLVASWFNYRKMNDLYFTYHTQDAKWCISRLLEINNLDETIFDNNLRLKRIIKEKRGNKADIKSI